jgi:hypothetical protein
VSIPGRKAPDCSGSFEGESKLLPVGVAAENSTELAGSLHEPVRCQPLPKMAAFHGTELKATWF